MAVEDWKSLIEKALGEPATPLWWPLLTPALARTGWPGLGLDEANYATARVLLRDKNAPCTIAAVFLKISLAVEFLDAPLRRRYEDAGAKFWPLNAIPDALPCLADALSLLRLVPSLRATVTALVRSLHLLEADGDEYDISFSEPDLPFSVFVSVPPCATPVAALRVAEAIVHEAMHLQLTLLERQTPLFLTASELYYSPWRGERRNAQGILHALYVFRVVADFLAALPPDESTKHHINQRRAQISQQINEVAGFRHCPELTPLGRILVDRLFGTE